MRSIKNLVAAVAVTLLLSTGGFAGSDLNEVGALLVFPMVVAMDLESNETVADMGGLETFVTITNAGPTDLVAHVSYINGDWNDEYQYCYECDFQIPLTGNDTETLVITSGQFGTHIVAEDLSLDLSCPWHYGMIVVSIEDEDGGSIEGQDGNTISDNVLLGEEVVVDYVNGMAFSIPAIPFQGTINDGNREFDFDDSEYSKMPRIVAADFLAPYLEQREGAAAILSLFTLGFERQFPPLVDCSVVGFDANENPFSASFQFGCWTMFDLYAISPEFYFPNLGLFNNEPDYPNNDTHGWLQLNCRVDSNPAAADGFDADGGVHGAIWQVQVEDTTLPAGSKTPFGSSTMWGRLLYQSVTTGDDVTLILVEDAQGMD